MKNLINAMEKVNQAIKEFQEASKNVVIEIQVKIDKDDEFKIDKPEYGERYNYVDLDGENGFMADYMPFNDDKLDNKLIEQFNCFETENEAENAKMEILALLKANFLYKKIVGDWKPDWNNDDKVKYSYYKDKNKICFKSFWFHCYSKWVFETGNDCKLFVEKMGNDIKYLT